MVVYSQVMDDRRERVAMAIWAANEGTRWVKNWHDLESGVAERYFVMADAAISVLDGGFEPATYGKELQVHNKAIPKKKSTRGERLPEGFVPREETIAKMADELGLQRDQLVAEHRKFCDYWLAIPGQRGVKLDWDRTWCNWMRTAAERGQLGSTSFVPPAPRRRNNDDKIRELMEMDVDASTE